ncbi:MAG: hypothetical protein QM765_40155 [Myxococcales bacterium]
MPPPLSVTSPPPSMTVFLAPLLFTSAWASRVRVTGALPQLKVMTPPFHTASTKAFEVQDCGVPSPMTVVGAETSSGRASAGTSTRSEVPAAGRSSGMVMGVKEAPPLQPSQRVSPQKNGSVRGTVSPPSLRERSS